MSDETETLSAGQKVATTVAESEFERFTEAMDFNLDPKGWDDEDKKSFNDTKAILVRAIERGHLIINVDGEPVYTPQSGQDKTPITFHEPKGSHFTSTDMKKPGHIVGKTHLLLAQMTGCPIGRFESMVQRDYKVCTSVLGLFLGSR